MSRVPAPAAEPTGVVFPEVDGRRSTSATGRSVVADALLPVDDVDEWFLCGPLPLTDTVRGVLLDRGVDGARVHRELFHVGPTAPRVRSDAGTPGAGAPVGGSAATFVITASTSSASRAPSESFTGVARMRTTTPSA